MCWSVAQESLRLNFLEWNAYIFPHQSFDFVTPVTHIIRGHSQNKENLWANLPSQIGEGLRIRIQRRPSRPGGTQLSFWYECAARRAENRLRERTVAKLRVLKNWFLSNLRLSELKFDLILGLRTELFPDFETLKCEFSENWWFQSNIGSWGTEKVWNGGLMERPGGREKGVLRTVRTHNPFSGEYPPRPSRGHCLHAFWLSLGVPQFQSIVKHKVASSAHAHWP